MKRLRSRGRGLRALRVPGRPKGPYGKRERGPSNRLPHLSACSAETESVQGRQAPSRDLEVT